MPPISPEGRAAIIDSFISLSPRVETLEAKAKDFEARLQILETKTDELIEAVRHWGEALLQTNPGSMNDSY